MQNLPLTIDPNHLHTIAAPRCHALRHFKKHGVALWVRANDSATLFYRDPVTGRRRQKTFRKIRVAG